MEHIAIPKALIVPLLLIILINTWLAHSRNLPNSPSPAPASIGPATATYTRSLKPYEARKANPRWGSFPATCHSKCNQCRPCVPVEVSIRTMTVEKNQYYPIAWKCMCQSNIFSP